jgi:hypothetical protein
VILRRLTRCCVLVGESVEVSDAAIMLSPVIVQ